MFRKRSDITVGLTRRREFIQASPDQLSYETSRCIGTRVQRFGTPLRNLIQIAQAYLFLQPHSTIMTGFIVEGVSCVIPLDRFWIACHLKVSSCALFCWVSISFTKLKEQC